MPPRRPVTGRQVGYLVPVGKNCRLQLNWRTAPPTASGMRTETTLAHVRVKRQRCGDERMDTDRVSSDTKATVDSVTTVFCVILTP